MRFAQLCLVFVGCTLSACTLKLDRTNPLDPSSPPEMQRAAQITGRVILEDNSSAEPAELAVIGARSGEQARRLDTRPLEDGTFLIEAPAGTYSFSAKLSGYVSQPIAGITLLPGETYDLGDIYMTVLRGSIRGFVRKQTGAARDSLPAAGAQVTLTRAGAEGTAGVSVAGENGDYRVDGLPAGTYDVHASLPDFVPGKPAGSIVVNGAGVATAADVTLYPSSAIVQIKADGVVGAPFTRSRSVEVQLLAFVENLTHMRVSLDPAFADATLGDTTFVDFNASRPFTLRDQDGEQQIYAQFRDSSDRVTQSFSGKITLDRSPPVVSLFTVGTGAAFVTQTIVPILATGVDPLSGIDRYRLSIDGTLDTEPELDTTSVDKTVALDLAQSLGVSDGPKNIVFVWIDRAGNVSAETHVDLYKDTQAPVTSAPAIDIAGGAAQTASTSVTLTFNVTGDRMGEPLFVALSSSMGGTATRVPLADAASYVLSTGDGVKTVCARYYDAAGNSTSESCDQITLDTTGALHGIALLQGETVHDSIIISLTNADHNLSASPSPMTGEFVFPSVPQGVGYVLTLSNAGFTRIVEKDIVVVAGVDQDRGTYTLSKAKSGDITGTISLAGGAAAQGVVVTARTTDAVPVSVTSAITDSSGFWRIAPLLLGDYTFIAAKEGFETRQYASVSTLSTEGLAADLGTLALGVQTGAFRICNGTEVGGCVINVEFTRESALKLGFNLDADSPEEYTANEVGAAPATGFTGWQGLSSYVPYSLADTIDGSHTISVWYRKSGTTVTGPFTASVTFDDDPPSVGSVSIAGGSPYTNTTSVDLSLSATDATSGVGTMVISNDDRTFDELSLPYKTSVDGHTIPSAETAHTVFVRFCDKAGNCLGGPTGATGPNDSIIYDHTPPTGTTFSINAGDAYTNSPFVTLSLNSTDAVAVRYGTSTNLDAIEWTGIDTGVVSLPAVLQGADATKTLYVQFRDAAGNASSPPLSDTISLDRTAPSVVSFGFAQGARTNTTQVTVNMNVVTESPVVQYTLASNPTFTGAAGFAGVTGSTGVTLSSGDGEKVVYGRFRDAAGNSVDVSATIVLDMTAPNATLTLDSGAAYTTDTTVDVAVSGLTESVTYFLSTTYPDCATVAPYLAAPPATIVVSAPEEEKKVYLCIKDAAGNTSQLSDTITLDAASPTGSIAINGGDTYATDSNVVLTLDAADTGSGILSMLVSNDSSFVGALPEAFTSTKAWTLASGSSDGLKTVYLRLTDAAGRVSNYSDTITLDTTPPTVNVSINSGAQYSTSFSVTVGVSGSTGIVAAAYGEGISCDTAVYSAQSTMPFTITGAALNQPDGLKTYTVCLEDSAGLRAGGSDTITVDSIAPTITSLSLDGGEDYAITTATSLAMVVSDDVDTTNGLKIYGPSGATGYSGAVCPTGSAAYSTFANPSAVTLAATDFTLQSIGVCIRDRAGNVTPVVSTESIRYDDGVPAAPTVGLSGPVGPQCQNNSPTFTNCSFRPDLTRYANIGVTFTSAETRAFGYAIGPATLDCSAATYTTITAIAASYVVPYTLTGGEQTQTVKLCVKDGAGRTNSVTSSNIELDTTAPAALSFDSVTAGNHALTLAWSASSASDVNSYVIRVNPTGANTFGGGVRSAPTGPTSFSISTASFSPPIPLNNCADYNLFVAAVDYAGNQQFAAPITARPTLPAPQGVTAVGEFYEAAVAWTQVANAHAYGIVYETGGVSNTWIVGPTGLSGTTGPTGPLGPSGDHIMQLAEGATYNFSVFAMEDQDLSGTTTLCSSAASTTVAATTFGSEPLGVYLGQQVNEHYGTALAAGDLDGDGNSDLLVGAPETEQFIAITGQGSSIINDFGRIEIRSGFLRTARTARLHTSISELNAKAGTVVAVIPDLDQDSISEILVGAPGIRTVYLISGADGRVIKTFFDSNPTQTFGYAVAGGSDLNGDGYSDFAIGQPGVSAGFGQVRFYDGKSLTQIGMMPGPSPSFGSVLAGGVRVGSCVSGFAYCDAFVIGEPTLGRAYLAAYRSTIDMSPAFGTGANRFGASIVSLGDRGALPNGLGEFAVGEPGATRNCADVATGASNGRVKIFEARVNGTGAPTGANSPTGPVELTALCLSGSGGESLGGSLATSSGLQDGDAVSLVVGATGATGGENGDVLGRVAIYSYRGSPDIPKPLLSRYGRFKNGGFGRTVAGGDFDNDGRGDFAVGSPDAPGVPGANGAGLVEVFRGNALGVVPFASTLLTFDSKTYSSRGGTPATSIALQSPTNGATFIDSTLTATNSVGMLSLKATDAKGRTTTARASVVQFKAFDVAAAPTIPAPNNINSFGTAMAFVGDWNGDGYPELAVGDPKYTGPPAFAGRVVVMDGKTRVYNPAWTISGPTGNAECGASVAAIGDIDSNGFGDLAIGCPGSGTGGEVRIYRSLGAGAPTGFANSVIGPSGSTGSYSGARFGSSLASLGRFFDAPAGFQTLAVGAPLFSSAGRVEFVNLSWNAGPGTLSFGPKRPFRNGQGAGSNNSKFGSVIVGADLDGDGVREILMGAPESTNGEAANGGRVIIGRGATLNDDVSLVTVSDITSSITDAGYGTAMATIPDINGDGFDDLALGGPRFTAQGVSMTGVVWIVSGLDGTLFGTLPSPGPASQFGATVVNVGDVDRDGYSDIAVGAPAYTRDDGQLNAGAVYLYSTYDFQPFYFVAGDLALQALGSRIVGGYDLGYPIGGTATGHDNRPDFVSAIPIFSGAPTGARVKLFATEAQ